ncbi:GUN4 domain protein [Rippkaea orientalis PCC 8801]|uniref:GUN4 domain protein n=1 Tax=Rippkaea orientalis (strain PCC 8801 / RF-1) TaxID=41431 RepID=B7K196_RIPO1|nr:GUN4 domain-containing protein [Rippkaea orientalis]ACK66291.1 GUN4 domain protein [Rippkaea orientalis PCC 8801]
MKNQTSTPLLFISYRRDDSADVTGRIYDRLIQYFGKDTIFKDVDSIPIGVDFRQYIDQEVGRCQILLAIIGQQWLNITDTTGKRRLDDPQDFVRLEIESALKRNIPVVPVLVRGAKVPTEQELPPSLRELAYRNGSLVRSDPDFHGDLDRLILGIERHLEEHQAKSPQPSLKTSFPFKFKSWWLLGGLGGAIALILGIGSLLSQVSIFVDIQPLQYKQLEKFLNEQNWQAADRETAKIMLAATGREQEKWIDKKGINQMSCQEIRKIDDLWLKASQGKFGFSTQREIWRKVANNDKFGDLIGWRQNNQWLTTDQLQFNLSAPKGHLPSSSREGKLSGGWLVWYLLPMTTTGNQSDSKASQCWPEEKAVSFSDSASAFS